MQWPVFWRTEERQLGDVDSGSGGRPTCAAPPVPGHLEAGELVTALRFLFLPRVKRLTLGLLLVSLVRNCPRRGAGDECDLRATAPLRTLLFRSPTPAQISQLIIRFILMPRELNLGVKRAGEVCSRCRREPLPGPCVEAGLWWSGQGEA